MEEKRGKGRPRKRKMSAEQREEWYSLQWSLLQAAAAQVKPEAWNGTPDQKREQILQLQWLWENVLTPWARQLRRDLRDAGEEVPPISKKNKPKESKKESK